MEKDITRVRLIKELPEGIGVSFELGSVFDVVEFKPGRVRVWTNKERTRSLNLPNEYLEIVEG